MVAQLTGVLSVAGSNPGQQRTAAPPPRTVRGQGPNRRPKTARRLRYHSTGDGLIATGFPTAWSLLSENF